MKGIWQKLTFFKSQRYPDFAGAAKEFAKWNKGGGGGLARTQHEATDAAALALAPVSKIFLMKI